MTASIHYSSAVSAARKAGKPIVALESTIITHGMPFPENLKTAKAVEDAVRHEGAEPATIAVLEGALCVGLETDTLDALARADDVSKLSRADLAVAMATRRTGSTTVAATMIAARAAGIDVFATGGIGGVHAGAESSFDISADLQELAQTAVTVIAAGAKAILDLPKTLEVLETLGVPVIAVGQDAFPAFWSQNSGLPAPLRLDTPAEIAAAHVMRASLALPGGQLVANPVPAKDEIPKTVLDPVIAQTIEEAKTAGITGKDVTPFMLGRIAELTSGASLSANVALVLNNARLGARIAAEICAARMECT